MKAASRCRSRSGRRARAHGCRRRHAPRPGPRRRGAGRQHVAAVVGHPSSTTRSSARSRSPIALAQLVDPVTGAGRDRDRPRVRRDKRVRPSSASARSILFTHEQLGDVAGADLARAPRAPPRSACSASGATASTTCTSRSASTTSSSVDRNASTSWCGRRRTKPTVSESRTVSPPGSRSRRVRRVERREQPVLDEHVGVA